MVAGQLHNIGHGPFSHVLDYFLKEYCKSDHEKKASVRTKISILRVQGSEY